MSVLTIVLKKTLFIFWVRILMRYKYCFAITKYIIRDIKVIYKFFSSKILMLLGENFE